MAMGLAPCTPPLLYQGHLGVWGGWPRVFGSKGRRRPLLVGVRVVGEGVGDGGGRRAFIGLREAGVEAGGEHRG